LDQRQPETMTYSAYDENKTSEPQRGPVRGFVRVRRGREERLLFFSFLPFKL
jgi:hypothetical protein